MLRDVAFGGAIEAYYLEQLAGVGPETDFTFGFQPHGMAAIDSKSTAHKATLANENRFQHVVARRQLALPEAGDDLPSYSV
jgi:hypothetical protein